LHGIQKLILKNNECETIGGCSSNAIGITLGGANAGAQGASFSDFRVIGFGAGIHINRSELSAGGTAFRDCTASYNSTGVRNTDWWVDFAVAILFVVGRMVTSAGRTTGSIVLNETKVFAAVQNNSPGELTKL